ncbi:hypothetical protein Lal_00037397 [Lupinus albus]|uniref:glucan endo-1,3-beta-D-glucosidase n=1 Tax=Lupinus albus TaxID=3870 RepID=A0A6A5P0S1_LUPAL|nr:putative glucan endo-1,3-beta-D-glucosidase [Lupinus albus]KAF1890827.1 hypothetical protein Lal_00037397 [Lupinus albus]
MDAFISTMTITYIFLALFLSSDIGSIPHVKSFGINYGQVGNNLPQPNKVLELLSTLKLTKTRIYDTNPQILTSFANSNIELIVTVENEVLSQLDDPQQALQWVNSHIIPYLPETKITGIQVGNEVFTDDDDTLLQHLVPAVVNIHNALSTLGYSNIKVSTPSSLAVLQNSYPPSAGSFKSEINGIMYQFLNFLSTTKTPFWINAYPFFAYEDDPSTIPLDYVLGNNPNAGMVDPYTKLHYDNMLYAMVDAVYFAIAKMGFRDIEVRVSETGWPSKGDTNEVGASPQNAATYNRNLLRRQVANEGTPLNPRIRLEVYLFALFNEDMKPGPTSERNYGLFQPNESMTYNVGLTSVSTTSTSTPSSSASFTLSSSATKTKVASKENQSLVLWIFVYLLILTLSL